jgi:hypothetical protein
LAAEGWMSVYRPEHYRTFDWNGWCVVSFF